MALVEGIEQPSHVVAIPDVAPLDFGQGHVAAIDVVEDGGDLHGEMSLKEEGVPARDCLGDVLLTKCY